MTKEEWVACEDPALLFSALGMTFTNRKFVLFSTQCCHRSPIHRRKKYLRILRNAWAVAERFADGQASIAQVRKVWGLSGQDGQRSPGWPERPREWARVWV